MGPAAGSPPNDKPSAEKGSREASEDLKRWKKIAGKGRMDKALGFTSSAIAPPLQEAIRLSLREARSAHDLDWTFRVLTKARRPLISVRRRLKHEKAVRSVVLEHFEKQLPAVTALAVEAFKRLQKDDESVPKPDLDEALAVEVLMDELEEPIQAAYLDGEEQAADAMSVDVQFGLTSQQASDYAEERAAELVGRKVLADGTTIDNPNPRFAISETVRKRLNDLIAKAVADGWTQDDLRRAVGEDMGWDDRARVIARTEVAFALNRGAAEVYRNAGVVEGTVIDGEGCLEDGHDDNQEGVDGEVWPLTKFEEYPIGHPNCIRDWAPTVPEEA